MEQEIADYIARLLDMANDVAISAGDGSLYCQVDDYRFVLTVSDVQVV